MNDAHINQIRMKLLIESPETTEEPEPIQEEGAIIETKPKQVIIPVPTDSHNRLLSESTALLIEICKNLRIPLEVVHISLWLFNCQVKQLTFRKLDRFVYLGACILVGTKLGEHIRNPQDILHQIRSILKRNKKLPYLQVQDSEEVIKKHLRKMFEAEVNIMISFGFDFDLNMAISEISKEPLKTELTLNCAELIDKIKQTLTSLYRTETCLWYQPKELTLTAVEIVMKNEGISIEKSGFSEELVNDMIGTNHCASQIKSIKKMFMNSFVSPD